MANSNVTLYRNSDVKQEPSICAELQAPMAKASQPDPAEAAASFGRWWIDRHTRQLVLSEVAADFLDVKAGWHPDPDDGFALVMPDDVMALMSAITQVCEHGHLMSCEFRVLNAHHGLRWLRMVSLPDTSHSTTVDTGILVDITTIKHAAMRERFSFESAQYLVGSHPIAEAVSRIIQLVCETLGWEWGAYWSVEHDTVGGHAFARQYCWHRSGSAWELLAQENCAIRIGTDEGLIGRVWRSGKAQWVEEMSTEQDLNNAFACGLKSGYIFPVSYVAGDAHAHSPGVLEFFSCLPRQPEAQLPNLSAAIGSLIAQTVQRHEQHAYMRRLAQTDALTGLANRSHFYELLTGACQRAEQANESFGVMFIDLDHFKPVNDVLGHEAGNHVLMEFALRLMQLTQGSDTVGRLGGDEFAILSGPTRSPEQLRGLGEQVLLAARSPFMFNGTECRVSASIGISLFPDHGRDGPELLRNSDSAMYRSKRNGRDALTIFVKDEGPSRQLVQLNLETELHRALRDDEFFLEYQPVFDALEDRMIAVEALIRWRHPSGEVIRPDAFIPVASKSRLILQIGRWVVARACRDLANLHRAGHPNLQVNVNLAMPDFTNTLLPDELTAIVQSNGLSPHHLCLEVTEGLVMKDPEKVIAVMHALREKGFGLSLDDFGMGHSSLSWLKQLPITSLKIDRSFVSGLPSDVGDGAIVRTILDLGRHMKLKVVAEGVENDSQLLYLQQFGCHFVQGYLFSRPKPVTDLLSA